MTAGTRGVPVVIVTFPISNSVNMNLRTRGTKKGDKYNQPGTNSLEMLRGRSNRCSTTQSAAEPCGLRQRSILCQVGRKTRHDNNSITIWRCLCVPLFRQCSTTCHNQCDVMNIQAAHKSVKKSNEPLTPESNVVHIRCTALSENSQSTWMRADT
jgi:hypothetical protein